jgi:tetratricopeptide (TPR) repeat protein
MPLEHDDAQHLVAALGYVELGMFVDADQEMDRIDPEVRHLPEVLAVRADLYQCAKNWDLMFVVVKRLAEYDPTNIDWIAMYAYAARRAESLGSAKAILLSAVERNPVPAIFHYNLACYHCQLGERDEALQRLKQAFRREKKYRSMALEDPDLEPLWDSLGNIRQPKVDS